MRRLWERVLCRWGWHWWSPVYREGVRPMIGEVWIPVRFCRACGRLELQRSDGQWVEMEVSS